MRVQANRNHFSYVSMGCLSGYSGENSTNTDSFGLTNVVDASYLVGNSIDKANLITIEAFILIVFIIKERHSFWRLF